MTILADPVRLRKTVAGVALIGFPLAGLLSSIADSDEGTNLEASTLYGLLIGNEASIRLAGLLFIVSAVLTVPAIGGMLHLLRGRGAALGHVGAAFALVGAFGHMGYATWQLMLAHVPNQPDQAAMVAYLDRSSSVSDLVLLPMLIAITLGLILMAVGLRKARFVPLWVPLLAVSTVAAESVVSTVLADSAKWSMVAIWTMVLVAFGYVGVRLLRMTSEQWSDGVDVTAPDAGAGSAGHRGPARRPEPARSGR